MPELDNNIKANKEINEANIQKNNFSLEFNNVPILGLNFKIVFEKINEILLLYMYIKIENKIEKNA